MTISTLTLDAPSLVTINARGGITGEQRRVLVRDYLAQYGKPFAQSIGIIAASIVMLRILLPVGGDIVHRLLTDTHTGSTPVRFGSITTVVLPLWTVLEVFLLLLLLGFAIAFVVQVVRIIGLLYTARALIYGRVATVVGEVRIANGQPYAIFAGRQIRPWDARAMAGIPEGHYRFFVLPRFDWLLSAQPISNWEHPTADEEAVAARYSLSAVNGFSTATLPENRHGRLTLEQARYLSDTAPDIGWRTVVLFGISIALGVGGVAVTLRQVLSTGFTQDRLGTVAAGSVWAAIWVYLLVTQVKGNKDQKHDAQTGQVLIYEGVVNKWEGWKDSASDGANTWVRYYTCPGGQFEVSQEAFRALADGLVHRVYHTERSKHLVNIELLPAHDERERPW